MKIRIDDTGFIDVMDGNDEYEIRMFAFGELGDFARLILSPSQFNSFIQYDTRRTFSIISKERQKLIRKHKP